MVWILIYGLVSVTIQTVLSSCASFSTVNNVTATVLTNVTVDFRISTTCGGTSVCKVRVYDASVSPPRPECLISHERGLCVPDLISGPCSCNASTGQYYLTKYVVTSLTIQLHGELENAETFYANISIIVEQGLATFTQEAVGSSAEPTFGSMIIVQENQSKTDRNDGTVKVTEKDMKMPTLVMFISLSVIIAVFATLTVILCCTCRSLRRPAVSRELSTRETSLASFLLHGAPSVDSDWLQYFTPVVPSHAAHGLGTSDGNCTNLVASDCEDFQEPLLTEIDALEPLYIASSEVRRTKKERRLESSLTET